MFVWVMVCVIMCMMLCVMLVGVSDSEGCCTVVDLFGVLVTERHLYFYSRFRD